MSRVSFPSPFLNENGKMGLPKLGTRKNTTIKPSQTWESKKYNNQAFPNLGNPEKVENNLSQTWESKKI